MQSLGIYFGTSHERKKPPLSPPRIWVRGKGRLISFPMSAAATADGKERRKEGREKKAPLSSLLLGSKSPSA